MPYTPEQVEKYLAHVADVSKDKYTPEQFAQYADHIRKTAITDEKPAAAGMLPEGVGNFLFPSPRDAVQMRQAQGMSPVPPEPVVEYSPAEEIALGSILGPAAGRAAAPAMANGARAVNTAAKGLMAEREIAPGGKVAAEWLRANGWELPQGLVGPSRLNQALNVAKHPVTKGLAKGLLGYKIAQGLKWLP